MPPRHHIPFLFTATLLFTACAPLSLFSQTSVSQQINPTDPSSAPAVFAAQPTPQRETAASYSTTDRPDDVSGYQVHFIYAIPSDGIDDYLDVDGSIALSAAALNYWLEARTERRLRLDTYEGELDVSFMQLDATADEISDLGTEILSLIEREIKLRDFNADHKLYVVHYDGLFVSPEGFCGLASYPPDGAGITAVLLLRGYNPELDLACPRQFTRSEDFTGYLEMTTLHELLHLMGMVPQCAPNYADGHVDDSAQDLLYYQYDGSYSPLYTYLDLDNDDYFNHGKPGCQDFAKSIFLDPTPVDAELPPGWEVSTSHIPENPLEPSE